MADAEGRARRAVVVVPVVSEAALAYASTIDADEIVLDLDTIPAADKTDFVRIALADAVMAGAWRAPVLAVQINLQGTVWFDEDLIQLIMLIGSGLDCMVVPNVTSVENLAAASELLDEIEFEFPVERPTGLEVRIGSPDGVARINEIVRVSDRLEAIVFDSAAYAEALSGSVSEPDRGTHLREACSTIFAAAHAVGLAAVEGPERPQQHDSLIHGRLAAEAGYQGKWTYEAADVAELRRIFGH
ncbi:MAG: hypothetical protein EOP24_28020 [Hyphomicrobiales bacterium]|nr:MAG: hypothetical protein EOP24_28020 [Hyphomicrobiales bacterium]